VGTVAARADGAGDVRREAAGPVLRTRPQPLCPVCGSGGGPCYERLEDHLFGVVGSWSSRACDSPDCGLLWLDPAPLEADLGLAYGDYFTHVDAGPAAPPGPLRRIWEGVKQGYFARRFGYPIEGAAWKRPSSWILEPFPTRRESLDVLGLHLSPVAGGRMLEVGCGSGSSLVALHALGWNAEGLDFDPAAGGLARGKGIVVRQGGLAEQNYPAHSFDAIAMIHAIEHVPDPLAFLRELKRVLKPGGQLVLITPNAAARGHRRFGSAWLGLDAPRHVQVFTAAALRQAVERTGFTVGCLRSTARMAAYIHSEGRRIEAGLPRPTHEAASTFADRWFQLQERLALPGDPWSGEELVLLARG